MREGIILKALSGFYYVDDGSGTPPTACRARGRFRYTKISPLVGDRVRFTSLPDGSGAVDEILPRRNQFQRPAVANIDQMVIIASGAVPVTDPFLIDRMISLRPGRAVKALCASISAIWILPSLSIRFIGPPASRRYVSALRPGRESMRWLR